MCSQLLLIRIYFMKKTVVSAITLASMLAMPFLAQADIVALQPTVAVSAPVVTSPLSCVDLHSTLKLGSKGYEVRGLQFALIHEGFTISVSEYGTFGADTLSAVTAFQLKYASDILGKSTTANGKVGKMTRAKINSIYGCSVTNSMMGMATSSTPALPSKVSLAVRSVELDSNGVTGTFCNNSPTDIPVFPVRLRLNGIIRDFSVTGATKAGSCDTETLPYGTWGLTFDPNVTFSLVSGLDPLSMYKTSQVTYPSVGTTTFSVAAVSGAHLSVRGVVIKSSGLQTTFCNLGTTDLSSFPVRLTLNGANKDVDVPGAYMHGQCSTVTWTYDQFGLPTLPSSGTSINATVNVDPNNTYKETNEFDNSATIFGNI